MTMRKRNAEETHRTFNRMNRILSFGALAVLLFVGFWELLPLRFFDHDGESRYVRGFAEWRITDEDDLKIYRRGRWMIAELEPGVGRDPVRVSNYHLYYEEDSLDNMIMVIDTARFFELEDFAITLMGYGSSPADFHFKGERRDTASIRVIDAEEGYFLYHLTMVRSLLNGSWRVVMVKPY